MAGLALVYEKNNARVGEATIQQFAQRIANIKRVSPGVRVTGEHCAGIKFDAPASLHRGVCVDAATGSWLIAAGTVIDPKGLTPDGNLETLLRDYVAQGERVLARLDGLFALAIYNGRTRTLSIVSDPFGFYALFYGEHAHKFFISTSALAVAQQMRAAPNRLGLECFLRTGKVFGELTLWQGVKRVRPATVLNLSARGVEASIYWTPLIDPALTKLNLSDAVDAAVQVVPAILHRNLAREGKVWSDLTGGFDSRFLAVLLERAGIPFKANFVGADEHPDVQIAKQIVAATGWEHQHFELPRTWAEDAPAYLDEALERGDGHLNVLLMLRPLWVHHCESTQFSTLLSGLGGEMWRGLNWWSERAALGSPTVHYERQLWSLMHPVPAEVLTGDARAVQAELGKQFQQIGEAFVDAPNTFKLDAVYAYRETAHAGAWSTCAAGLLRILPAMFSKDIVTFVMSLDYRWRADNALVKHLLARYKPALAEIEIEGRGPAMPFRWNNWYRFIPSRLVFARKAIDKFSQVAFGKTLWQNARPASFSRTEWLQAIMRDVHARKLFDSTEMRTREVYRVQALPGFLAQVTEGRFKHEEFLGRMITLEMAMQRTKE